MTNRLDDAGAAGGGVPRSPRPALLTPPAMPAARELAVHGIDLLVADCPGCGREYPCVAREGGDFVCVCGVRLVVPPREEEHR